MEWTEKIAVDSTSASWIAICNLQIPKHTPKSHISQLESILLWEKNKIHNICAFFFIYVCTPAVFSLFCFVSSRSRFDFHIWWCAKHKRMQCLHDKLKKCALNFILRIWYSALLHSLELCLLRIILKTEQRYKKKRLYEETLQQRGVYSCQITFFFCFFSSQCETLNFIWSPSDDKHEHNWAPDQFCDSDVNTWFYSILLIDSHMQIFLFYSVDSHSNWENYERKKNTIEEKNYYSCVAVQR